jgi:sigma-54 dependent transcriptional regulator, acetoin dehydrogenase operon transcriptional activator AcoR
LPEAKEHRVTVSRAEQQVERVRDAYFETGTVPDGTVVRPVILQSWRRSRGHGLRPATLRPVPAVHRASELQLARIGREVLAPQREHLAGFACGITLTDADGCILDSWVTGGRVASRLDEFRLTPGFTLAERAIGTCGAAVALETGGSALVVGAEHVAAAGSLATAGAAVRHPLTRRTYGSVSITALRGQGSPMLLSWAEDQAEKIERRLQETLSAREDLLLAAYRAVARDARHPVICLDERTVISNAAATRIPAADRALLWEHASALVADGGGGEFEIGVADADEPVTVVCAPVSDDGEVFGATLQFRPRPVPRTRPARTPAPAGDAQVLPGLAGRSPAWLKLCQVLRRALDGGDDILLFGGAGTGKSAIAEVLHRELPGARRIDAQRLARGSVSPFAALQQELRAPGTVIVDDAYRVGEVFIEGLGAILDHRGDRARVVLTTLRTGPAGFGDADLSVADRWPGVVLQIPTVRDRTGDLPLLLDALTARRAAHRRVWAPETVQNLSRVLWTANVASLENLVEEVLRRTPDTVIRQKHLPVEIQALASRRPLEGLDYLEAQAIAAALRASDFNKSLAADRLRISRSTLYRKLRLFGIDLAAAAY